MSARQFLADFIHPDHIAGFWSRHCQNNSDGRAFQCRMSRKRPVGKVLWVEFFGNRQPSVDEAPMRIIGTLADITASKDGEEELRCLAANLSKADRRKTEFLATLAHELRNPLAPIRHGLQLMRMQDDNFETFHGSGQCLYDSLGSS